MNWYVPFVNWCVYLLVHWYVYLPSIIPIYLIVISPSMNRWLSSLVDNFKTEDQAIEGSKKFIKDVAQDWATRLSFINSMFVGLLSFLSIYARTQALWVALMLVFILLVYWRVLVWINTHASGKLVSASSPFGIGRFAITMRHSTKCRYFLLLVYIVLFVMNVLVRT